MQSITDLHASVYLTAIGVNPRRHDDEHFEGPDKKRSRYYLDLFKFCRRGFKSAGFANRNQEALLVRPRALTRQPSPQ